jgi:thioredoxin 1
MRSIQALGTVPARTNGANRPNFRPCFQPDLRQIRPGRTVTADTYAVPGAGFPASCQNCSWQPFGCLSPHSEAFMSSDLIKHVSDASFEQDVIQSDKPVLVDYWAEWCGPCKMIAPFLDTAASHFGDKLQVAKMNVDENRAVPAKFGIRGIPTLMIFKNGELADTKVGALSQSQLTEFINKNL